MTRRDTANREAERDRRVQVEAISDTILHRGERRMCAGTGWMARHDQRDESPSPGGHQTAPGVTQVGKRRESINAPCPLWWQTRGRNTAWRSRVPGLVTVESSRRTPRRGGDLVVQTLSAVSRRFVDVSCRTATGALAIGRNIAASRSRYARPTVVVHARPFM